MPRMHTPTAVTRTLTLAAATAAVALPALVVHAQDGPNLLQNPGFEQGLDGYYSVFGNAFLNQEYAYEGINSLKIFGCFCGDFNGNGAVSTYTMSADPGQVYRVTAQMLNPESDSVVGTGSWGGIKIEFKNAQGAVVGLGEQRIIEGVDLDQELNVWEEGNFLVLAPDNAATMNVVLAFLQAQSDDAGTVFLDAMSVAEAPRDPDNPVINGGFDLGVDYQYQIFPTFNGWTEQYGNIFFDDAFYASPPFSAGMFGSFPDYDGDGQCDPGGVSGLNQLIPDISEGDEVTLSMSAYTPNFDSIIGTKNSVEQAIEFLGDETSDPLLSVVGVVMDGSGVDAEDTWHRGEITATAPAGTRSMRIVTRIIQPDCEGGSVRIDDVRATVVAISSGDCNGDGIADRGQILDGTLPDDDANGVPDCCDIGTCIPGQTGPFQWRTKVGGNGHWYAFHGLSKSWTDSRAHAIALGGDLATITSIEEQDFIAPLLPGPGGWSAFIGASDSASEGSWEWVSGEPWNFEYWTPGAPYGDGDFLECGGGNSTNFPKWNDVPDATTARGLVIEWSADCNGDGIVDYGQILNGTFEDANSNGVPNCCEDDTCLPAVQWRVEDGGNGHWYQKVDFDSADGDTFESLRNMALAIGSDLASITSAEEDGFLAALARGSVGQGVMFGVEGNCGSYRWSDGSPWRYTDWGFNQPDCAAEEVVGYYEDGWHDLLDFDVAAALLEWSADCNNDGIVDYGQIVDGTFPDDDGNGVPDCCDAGPPCEDCLGDITGNGIVNAADLGILLAVWGSNGKSNPETDINHDGIVNAADLGLLLGSWGICGP